MVYHPGDENSTLPRTNFTAVFLDSGERVKTPNGALMEILNIYLVYVYIDGIIPKPPFSLFFVPPTRHVWEKIGSENRPRGSLYLACYVVRGTLRYPGIYPTYSNWFGHTRAVYMQPGTPRAD